MGVSVTHYVGMAAVHLYEGGSCGISLGWLTIELNTYELSFQVSMLSLLIIMIAIISMLFTSKIELLNEYRHQLEQKINISLQNTDLAVYVRESNLEQLFTRLLKLSIQAFNVNTQQQDSRQITIYAEAKDSNVHVVYQDNAGSRDEDTTQLDVVLEEFHEGSIQSKERFDLVSLKSEMEDFHDGRMTAENLEQGLRVELILNRAKVSV